MIVLVKRVINAFMSVKKAINFCLYPKVLLHPDQEAPQGLRAEESDFLLQKIGNL